MNIRIVAMSDEHWPAVREIYAEGIATGNATFETIVPEWVRWDTSHHKHSRLVATDGERTLGWAALSPVSARAVYAGVAEVSIYVSVEARGRGVGGALMKSLVEQSEQNGIWMLQAGIFRRTSRASHYINPAAFVKLVGASGLGSWPACGEMSCSSSAGVKRCLSLGQHLCQRR